MGTPTQRRWLWGLLAAALLVRVLAVVTLESKPLFYEPQVDAKVYDDWGWRIATKDALGTDVFYMDPLYAYFLGAYYAVAGHDVYGVRILQAVLGASGCLALFLAARRLFGVPTALVALAMAGFYETFIAYDAALTKDFLGPVLMSWVLAAIAAALASDRRRTWLGVGVLLGLLGLVRGNALLVAAALVAGLVVARRRAGLAAAAAVVLGTALAIAPATARNWWVARDLVLTTAQLGPNFYTGNHPGNETGRYEWPSFIETPSPEDEGPGFRREAERRLQRPLRASEVDAFWLRETFAYIATQPTAFVRVTAKRLAVLFNRFEIPDSYSLYQMREFTWVLRLPLASFGWVVGPLGLLGLVLGAREWRRLWWLYVVFVTYVASIAVFFVFDRYRLPMVPPLILFAACATTGLAARLRRRETRAAVGQGVVLVVALGLVRAPIERWMNVGNFDSAAVYYNLAMLYLRHQRCDLALPHLQRVPVERPELARSYGLWEMIGRCQMQTGDAAGARASFAKASALRREQPPGSE